jgi:hypothetical protein
MASRPPRPINGNLFKRYGDNAVEESAARANELALADGAAT